MHSVTAFVALSALTLVAAQNDTQFTITISDVDETERSKSQHCISPLCPRFSLLFHETDL